MIEKELIESSLYKRGLLLLLAGVWLLVPTINSFGQCKTFKLSDRGDTLNCIDTKGLKQGAWLESTPPIRINPGFEEEGVYEDGIRTGIWRKYTPQGDLISAETYKWGLKHGKSQYFSLMGLEREESWLAIDPQKKYDTIEFPDLYDPDKYQTAIIKNEGRSLRHGKWTYYDPYNGFISKTEEYIRDSAVNDLAMFGIAKKKETDPSDTAKKKSIPKPMVVEEWEKKNAGKKKIKVRDGSTGY